MSNFIEIQDEILNGDPKYIITQNNDGTSNIDLATEIIQDGTPLNKSTLETFANKVKNCMNLNTLTYIGQEGIEIQKGLPTNWTHSNTMTETAINDFGETVTATASSIYQNLTTYDYCLHSLMNSGTFWGHHKNSGVQVEIDLGREMQLSTINIGFTGENFSSGYVAISPDNTTWTTVSTVSETGYKNITFGKTSVRYIRLYASQSSTGETFGFYNLKIPEYLGLGFTNKFSSPHDYNIVNLSKITTKGSANILKQGLPSVEDWYYSTEYSTIKSGKFTISLSGTVNSNVGVKNVFDNTNYCSSSGSSSILTIDLGDVFEISKIQITAKQVYGGNSITVTGSTDGSTYNTLFTSTSSSSMINPTFEKTRVRYIKVNVLGNYSTSGGQFNNLAIPELEYYGDFSVKNVIANTINGIPCSEILQSPVYRETYYDGNIIKTREISYE